METSGTLLSHLRKSNVDFSLYLRTHISTLFPTNRVEILRLDAEGYFEREFYLVIYRTFLLYGWKLTPKSLVKVETAEIPFDLSRHIFESLKQLNQDYFSALLMLILCQNIFNYGYKREVGWPEFEQWMSYQEYITTPYLDLVKYRWNNTITYTRTEINTGLQKIDKSRVPRWKECIIKQSLISYKMFLAGISNYPEIQLVSPVLKIEGEDITKILRDKKYDAFKKIEITYKKEQYDFSQGDWWVDFANMNLGGGALSSGFVQEEILAVKFPELLYFSSENYKIPNQGAIVMTNLLQAINLPVSWYGRKNISTKSCWDIVSGIDKLDIPYFKSFIAIAAVDHSKSPSKPFNNYTEKEMALVFNRCYSGFMMAKILGAKEINSGALGTGVFNNSPVFMYTLQILAASAVGIDINFWGTNPNNEISLEEARKMLISRESSSMVLRVPFRGLVNEGSSCYMDSVLFSLLYLDNSTIKEKILKKSVDTEIKPVQDELIRIQQSIQGSTEVTTCRDFRALLRSIPGGTEFASPRQQDAGEFLFFIMNLFNVNGAVVKNTVYGTNDEDLHPALTQTSSFTDKKASLINFVDSFMLKDVPADYYLSDFLIKRSDTILETPLIYQDRAFYRKITREEVISVPNFYGFYLQRADPITNRVLVKPIIPNQSMAIGGKMLELMSVIIHVGVIDSGHYLVYFEYNNRWYIYNDVSVRIREIGSFEQMLQKIPSARSRGIIYFYGKK